MAAAFPFLTAKAANAPTDIIDSTQKVVDLFCAVTIWMFWGLLVVSVAMFFVGGYTYATSAGDPEKAGKANRTLLYAVIGIAIALCARGIPLLVGSFLGVDSGSLTACP